MNEEKLIDGRPLQEGMKFYLVESEDSKERKTLIVTHNENYPFYSFQKWLFLDEDGNDRSEEWYFFNGEYLEEVII